MRVAILVRMFPNIVQTYVLNHILSVQDHDDHATIIAEFDPQQDEVHPAIHDRQLLDATTYINITRQNFFRELAALPWCTLRYYALLPRLISCLYRPGMGAGYLFKSMFRVRAMLQGDIDIIHSHSLFTSYYYLFLKTCFDIPLVTTFHGLVPNDVTMLASDKVRAVLGVGDAFLVNTCFARAQLIEMGCEPERIHIIPQGSNLDEHPFSARKVKQDEPIIILSVGRLSVEKGFNFAIDAIAKLTQDIPQLEYRIVGRGLEHDALQQQIERLGLQNKVHLLGGVSAEELRQQYAAAHMFILPSISMHDGSHTETQGVVLQEAQSSGIPVIASRTGGIPEVIRHDETGLLFDERDVETLALHIRQLVEDPERYAALSTTGRRDVEENYSTEAIYRRQRNLYNDVIKQAHKT